VYDFFIINQIINCITLKVTIYPLFTVYVLRPLCMFSNVIDFIEVE